MDSLNDEAPIYVYAKDAFAAEEYARKYRIPTNRIKQINCGRDINTISHETEVIFVNGYQSRADFALVSEIASQRGMRIKYVG